MESIKGFTPEVCQQLKYYVYRLVDPRDGKTFYIGKGINNRVFEHAKCALTKKDSNAEKDNLKYATIRNIIAAGLEVICIIQRYGLEENEALLIESVLIDTYSLSTLTNKVKGSDSQEPKNAITLQQELSAPVYEDSPDIKYMIIKVKDYWVQHLDGDRYECTRRAWSLKPEKANQYPYVFSVTGGIVREVYKVHQWHYCENSNGKAEFDGVVAEESIRKKFVGKKIPEIYRKKGQANPFLYCKN